MTSLRLLSSLTLVLAITAPLAAQDGIRWQNDLDTAKQIAARTNRLVLIHYWIRGCAPCVKLEQNVFNQNEFGRSVEADFVPVKINAQDFPVTAGQFGVNRFPTDVVITPAGQVLLKSGCPQDARQYAQRLRQVAQSHRQERHRYASNRDERDSLSRYNINRRPDEGYAAERRPTVDHSLAARPDERRTATDVYRRSSEEAVLESRFGTADPNRYDTPDSGRYDAPDSGRYSTPDSDRYAENPRVDRQREFASQTPQPRHDDQRDRYAASRRRDMPYHSPRDDRSEFEPRPAPAQPAYGTKRNQSVEQPPASRRDYDGRIADSNLSQPSTPGPAPAQSLGLDGFCPVHLTESFSWVPGDKRWGAVHLDCTYLFASEQDRDRFMADPDRYSPVLSGYDAVQWSDHQKHVAGSREFGLMYRDRVYLFSSEQSLGVFRKNPNLYAARVEQVIRSHSVRR